MLKCRLVKYCLVFASILVIAACASSEKRLVDSKCRTCHSLEVVYNKHYSRNQWSNTIDAMIVRGMRSTPEENALMLDYLATHYGVR